MDNSKFPKKLFIIVLVLTLFVRGTYIQFRYAFVPSVYSYTPEESKDKGIFIKNLTPSSKELYFNRNYNFIIKEAWLEHIYYYKNWIYWLAVREDNRYVTLNIIYEFRDKRNGQITKQAEAFNNARIFIDGGYMGELPGLNLLFTHMENKPNLQLRTKYINDDDDLGEKGIDLTFK